MLHCQWLFFWSSRNWGVCDLNRCPFKLIFCQREVKPSWLNSHLLFSAFELCATGMINKHAHGTKCALVLPYLAVYRVRISDFTTLSCRLHCISLSSHSFIKYTRFDPTHFTSSIIKQLTLGSLIGSQSVHFPNMVKSECSHLCNIKLLAILYVFF